MGMTIDEAIYCMNSYLPDSRVSDCINCKYYGSKEGIFCCSDEAHQKAIDTMRKYQKIEQIAELLKTLTIDEMSNVEMQIREVLEDGNDD